MKKITVFFTPKNGKFNFEKPAYFKSLAKTLPEKRHIITVAEYKNNRSMNQNSYMWGVVYDIISKETGYEPEEVHQVMGKLFIAYFKNKEKFVKSTTNLTTLEMEDYLERVRRFASMELNCYIPLPNEQDNFYYEVKK